MCGDAGATCWQVGARIGIARDFMGKDAGTDAVVEAAIVKLRELGAVVVDQVRIPPYLLVAKTPIYGTLVAAEFKAQIEAGGPITVTHPEMTRFFMTIPEAVQLVMQAGAIGSSGDVLILDMGEPVKIVELAKDMIILSGLRYPDDIDIEFTGLRPGEKLYEELFYESETGADRVHEKIFRGTSEQAPPLMVINSQIRQLEEAAGQDFQSTLDQLRQIVDGYTGQHWTPSRWKAVASRRPT